MLTKLINPNFRYRYWHLMMIYLFFILFIVVSAIISPQFFTAYNLKNIVNSSFPLMMVAFGQSLIILTGGIDLSVGGIVSLSNVVAVVLMTRMEGGLGAVVAIIVTLIVGLLCGLLNGLLVAKGRMSPIIVTIATSVIFGGAALFVLPVPGGTVNMKVVDILAGNIFGVIPSTALFLVIVLIGMRLLTNSTEFGLGLRAIGGSEGSAFSTGIKVVRTKIIAYVLTGLLCAIAGIFLSTLMYSGDPNIGGSYSMYSITAAVVGGILMSGAVGDVLGTVAGVFIIYMINNMLNLMGVSSYYQYVFQGGFLIVALILSNLKLKR